MSEPEQPRVMLDDVTAAAFNGVLRALEARKIAPEKFPGPIICGIIAWPELTGQVGLVRRQGDVTESG